MRRETGNPCFDCGCGWYDSDLGCTCPSLENTNSCNPNLQRKYRTTLTGVLQTSNVRMDTKKGFLQRRAFFTISINGKEVQKSE